MNVIKGLIIKDLLQLKNYKKTLIIFIAVFILSSITSGKSDGLGGVLAIIFTLGFGMFSIATFSYDELAKADRYILTFPITKKEIVLSKYILVICSTVIGAILGTIISLIITFAINKEISNIMEPITIGIGAIFGLGLVEALQIPCIYKWGAEKGRIQIFIIAALIMLIGTVMMFLGTKINIDWAISDFFNSIVNFFPTILLIGTVIAYYISYKVSYKIYSTKEL